MTIYERIQSLTMPNLTDLRTEIEQLDDDLKRAYVLERSKVNTDKAGYESAGFSKATFYKWPTEERDYLNNLAQRIRTEVSLQIMMRLQEAGLDAVEVKIGGLKARNENIKQKSSTEILEWLIGKPTQKIDAKSDVNLTATIKQYETVSPDDWDEDSESE